MNMHTPTHPHAVVATFLAGIDRPQRVHISRELYITNTPRSLYTLARILRAGQRVDEKAAIDAINAAHPAVVAQAA